MIYEAGLVGFLRTVLIIGLAFYSIRFITRLIANKSNPDGDAQKPRKKKGVKKDDELGEYVDFEEVKD